jgi:hypothetical protein
MKAPVQAKLTIIQFEAVSAALAIEEMQSNPNTPQPVTGRVSIIFSGEMTRAGAVYPDSDMRVCEIAAAQIVEYRLTQFDKLLEENTALKAKLAAMESS